MLRQVARPGRQQAVSAPKISHTNTSSHVLIPQCQSIAIASSSSLNTTAAFFSTSSTTCLPAKRQSRGNRRRTRSTSQPRWRVRQTELGDQIRALEHRITVIDKHKKADEASKDLPSLDDEELLQQLYEGVKEPDQLPDADRRRLEYEKLKRYRHVVQLMKARLPGATTQRGSLTTQGEFRVTDFAQRMEKRLDSLTRRLTRLQQQTIQASGPSTSTTPQSIEQLQSEVDILEQMLQTNTIEDHEAQDVEAQQGQLADPTDDTADSQRQAADEAETPISEQAEDKSPEYTNFETLDFGAGGPVETTQLETHPPPDQSSLDTPAPTQAQLDPPGRVQQLLDMIQSTTLSRAHRVSILDQIQPQEWSAIGHACATSKDAHFLEETFTLLERLSKDDLIPRDTLSNLYTSAADAFASQGNIADTKRIIQRMTDNNLPLNNYAQHCYIKAHLRQDPMNTTKGAMEAMTLLNNLEEAGEPAAQSTYSLVLTHLLDSPEMTIKDEVWGLWNRMRLNAHPTPDAIIWSQMLRACALGSTPARSGAVSSREAHRGTQRGRPKQSVGELKGKVIHRGESQTALDLFREMTTVEGIKPNPACYDHLILACCRGGDQASFYEGFRLLSEMVTTAEELGLAAYEPTRMTYNALLEGCKTHKDVVRARWILAEMIRSSAALWSPDESGQTRRLTWEQRAQLLSRMPDAESLGKVFLAFAAWKPPRMGVPKRKAPEMTTTKGTDETSQQEDQLAAMESSNDASTAVSASSGASHSPSTSLSQPDMDEAATTFSATPPSTSAGVIREVRGLLARVVLDQVQPNDQEAIRGPMSAVVPSTHLLNSYLNVLKAHLPAQQVLDSLSSAVEEQSPTESSLFSKMGIEPDANTYELILDACVTRSKDTPKVDTLANWAWTQWRQIEMDLLAGRPNAKSRSISKSLVSRIWTARISFLAKRNRLDEAVNTLRAFVTLYPPTAKPADVSSGGGSSKQSRRMPYYDFAAVTSDLRRSQREKTSRLREIIAKLQWNLEQFHAQQQQRRKEITGPEDGAAAQTPSTWTRQKSSQLTRAFESSPTSSILQTIYDPRPPVMTFFNLNLLHQRLKTTSLAQRPSRDKDLKFLMWVSKVAQATEKVPNRGQQREQD